jgi:putative MATE family efflux protein
LTDQRDELDRLRMIDRASASGVDAPATAIAVEEAEALPAAEGAIRSGKLAGKSLPAAIWILAFPVALQQTAAAFLGLTDKIFAGHLPSDVRVAALDGLGIGSYIGWFIGIAMAGLGIGGQALIARAIGAGNRREAHHCLGQAMALSILWGAIVGTALWLAAPPVARLCGLSPDATRMCVDYIRILACSMPFCAVMMVGSMTLYGAGETAKPSTIMVLINLVNVPFSWALSGTDIRLGETVLVNPFDLDWHVAGIAAGTALSYAVGAILILAVQIRGVKDLRLEARELRLHRRTIWRLVRVGLPGFLDGMSMWAANLFVLMLIGSIAVEGDEGLQGAHIIAVQWEMFSILPGFAVGTAAGALAGQYLGANNRPMAQRAILTCTAITCVIMGSVGIAYMTLGKPLTAVISSEPIHQAHVPNLLFICGVTQVFFAIMMVLRQGLRGVGDTRWTFTITTIASYGVRLPAAWLFGIALGWGIEGIWIGLCGEMIVRAGMFSARFFHGGWKRIEV